jgi:LysR family transcriptional activator of nhaA
MQLNYKHLRYFWAVAHAGSLAKASAQLHLSSSALSIQIQKLEAQLGHDLFLREGRQLVLNEAGRVALDYADTIFEAGADLLGIMQGLEAQERRTLRIGAMATLSRNFQVRFLAPLLGRSDINIVARSDGLASLLQELEALRLDLVLVNTPPTQPHKAPWLTHLVGDQQVSLVGTPERIRPGDDALDLLASQPLILPSPDSSVRTSLDAWLDRRAIRPQVIAEVDDMAMIRLLTRANLGLAVVPAIVVQDELDSGRLLQAEDFTGIHETFYAITLKRRFSNPLVRELLDANDAQAHHGQERSLA